MSAYPDAAANLLARTLAELPQDTKRRRGELGMLEPRDGEVRSAEVGAGLIAAGWPEDLLSWDDRRYPGRTWKADRVTLTRRTDAGPVDVVGIYSHFDDRSDMDGRKVGDTMLSARELRTAPTFAEVYGAGMASRWDDCIELGDVEPTEAEIAIIAAVVEGARREIADQLALRAIHRWEREGGPEPNLDAHARRTARHRFTGWVEVSPIIPNRLWDATPQHGPAGYVRYWSPSEEVPRDRSGLPIHGDSGSSYGGHYWWHYTGRRVDELLRRDVTARLAVLKHREFASLRSAVMPDLPPPPAPADFRQAALFGTLELVT